ncbi:hypothetical protein SVIOM74S_02462 [Streptomyces violarus]
MTGHTAVIAPPCSVKLISGRLRPDFTSTVMQPALQNFVRNPKNVDSILSSIERQKKTIFASG